jgi:hypothetical protein
VKKTDPHEVAMTELLILLGVIAVWIFLQAYLLPKFGVST